MWQREVAWKRFDERGEERCGLACDGEICGAEGVGAVAINGSGLVFQYRIELGDDWQVRRAGIITKLGADEFTVILERHEDGNWSVGSVRTPQFDGCDDVDFAFSPATNTVAIRRMGLAVGESRVTKAILVTEPELLLEAVEQTYTRLDESRYEFRAGPFTAVITVDEDGIVSQYPGMFQAIQMVPG